MALFRNTSTSERLALRVAAAGLLATVAAGVAALPPNRQWQPAFTLEQAVRVRTLGHFAISPDRRTAAYGLEGHYFEFPVVPRFGDENNLHVVDLDSGAIRQATSGERPKTRPVFSPSGDRLAYESEDDIWVVRLSDGHAIRITTNRARDSAAAWSPDGESLVFVSNRGGSADLWIASAEGERHGLHRLTDDAALREDDPRWSPDGRSIAFSGRGPLDFYSSGVFLVTVSGGTAVRLTPPDDFDHSTPRWSPDGSRLAFLSDRSGFMHVWTMRPDGSDARHFDTGAFDSTSPYFRVQPIWSPDGRNILVSVNREGRFDLVRLSTADGSIRTLAAGDGRHQEVGWRHDGAVVFGWENAWSPPDLYVRDGDGVRRQLTFSSHVVFRESATARMERVRFPSTDGLEIPGFLMTPRQYRGGRLPAIALLHPNGYGQFYDRWNPFFHYLAESGYVLLLVDQRGSAGYGREFRRAQIGQWGTGTFEDVKAAAAFLRKEPRVDPDRVGVMGLSFGGYQSLLALTKSPDLFRAGVDLMGPTDRRGRPGDRYRELQIGAKEAEDPARYDRISPITSVASITAPLLIIHSDEDRNVAPEDTYRLIDELERQGKRYEAVIYPGEAHGLADPAHQLDSYRRIVTFFDRWLRP